MFYPDESVFTRFPDSPTAQRYLRAYQKARDGLQKLKEGNFKEAVKLMAHSYLYENTMLMSFPEMEMARTEIVPKIFEELKVNSRFYEGLVLLLEIHSVLNVQSLFMNLLSGNDSTDLKKTMYINNVINLIENDDKDADSDCNFEDNYKSWLHVLYFVLGSQHTKSNQYHEGAQAFEKSMQLGKLANPQPLKHCPVYFEAMAGFGYCLMNIYVNEISNEEEEDVFQGFSTDEQWLQGIEHTFKTYCQHQRVQENSFYRWKPTDVGKKAKEVFMEYLREAPTCNDKYPNCHYHLGNIYLYEGDLAKAREWNSKGEDAEKYRLRFPFKPDYSNSSKDELKVLKELPVQNIKKKCDNESVTFELELD